MIVLPGIGNLRAKSAPILYRSQASTITGPSGTALTVTKPAGVVSGDLLVFFGWACKLDGVSSPSGWTSPQSINNTFESTDHRAHLSWKIAGGSEPANYTWTFGTGAERQGVILAYQHPHSTQLDVSAVTNPISGGGSSSHAHATMTTLWNRSMLLYAWMFNRQGTGTTLGSISAGPSGMTQRYFAHQAPVGKADVGMAVYEEQFGAAGSIGTKTLTTSNGDVRSLGIRAAIRAQGT